MLCTSSTSLLHSCQQQLLHSICANLTRCCQLAQLLNSSSAALNACLLQKLLHSISAELLRCWQAA
jgi:hypothetical protein